MVTRLFAPPGYWEIKKDIRDSWGCGPGGLGDWLVPDTILGLSVKPACQIHDYYYRHWEDASEDARCMADRIFKYNMIRIIKGHHITKKIGFRSLVFRYRLWMSRRYYRAVCEYGGPSWHDDRNTEEEFKTSDWDLTGELDT